MSQPILYGMDFRLSYGECDPAGIVYYATYYPWMERVYNEWAYLGGFATDELRQMWGATHISIASGCEYRIPGKLFDPLSCRMSLRHVGKTSYSMQFDFVHRENEKTYATGHIVFVFIDDADPPNPVPLPDGLKQILRDAGCEF